MNDREIKVGDTVRVKTWDALVKEFPLDGDVFDCASDYYVSKQRVSSVGPVGIVTKVLDGGGIETTMDERTFWKGFLTLEAATQPTPTQSRISETEKTLNSLRELDTLETEHTEQNKIHTKRRAKIKTLKKELGL